MEGYPQTPDSSEGRDWSLEPLLATWGLVPQGKKLDIYFREESLYMD